MTYTQRMLGEVGARRALVVEALRRVLTIYTDWAGADPAVGAVFAATAAALPERVPDKLRAKLGKQLASATKAAQKAAGYDRKTRRDRDPAARAAAYVAMAVGGALEKHDTFETVTLGFVLLALEHAGRRFERIAETTPATWISVNVLVGTAFPSVELVSAQRIVESVSTKHLSVDPAET